GRWGRGSRSPSRPLRPRVFAPHDLDLLLELDQARRGVDPRAQLHPGVDLGALAHHAARVEDAVAAGEHGVAQDGAELAPAGRQGTAGDTGEVEGEGDAHLAAVVAEVREDGAGPQVDAGAQDRIADVVQVRRVGPGEED